MGNIHSWNTMLHQVLEKKIFEWFCLTSECPKICNQWRDFPSWYYKSWTKSSSLFMDCKSWKKEWDSFVPLSMWWSTYNFFLNVENRIKKHTGCAFSWLIDAVFLWHYRWLPEWAFLTILGRTFHLSLCLLTDMPDWGVRICNFWSSLKPCYPIGIVILLQLASPTSE